MVWSLVSLVENVKNKKKHSSFKAWKNLIGNRKKVAENYLLNKNKKNMFGKIVLERLYLWLSNKMVLSNKVCLLCQKVKITSNFNANKETNLGAADGLIEVL